jgi:hypothetical protein
MVGMSPLDNLPKADVTTTEVSVGFGLNSKLLILN